MRLPAIPGLRKPALFIFLVGLAVLSCSSGDANPTPIPTAPPSPSPILDPTFTLEPQEPLTRDWNIRGLPGAPITIIEFSDFQ